MSSSPKSESLDEELPEVTGVVKEEFERKLHEQRQQDEDKTEDDAAAEPQWQQQEIDAAARIDDLTTQIDVFENSLMIDRRHLDEMNRANEFTAQSRFAQPLEVTAQGRILEATNIYCSYLINEYRASKQELQVVVKSENPIYLSSFFLPLLMPIFFRTFSTLSVSCNVSCNPFAITTSLNARTCCDASNICSVTGRRPPMPFHTQ